MIVIGMYHQDEICKKLCWKSNGVENQTLESIENGEPQAEQIPLVEQNWVHNEHTV